MTKFIIHINPKCKFTEQEQCVYAVHLLPTYTKAHGKRDIRLTAYWERQKDSDTLLICHDSKDVGIWSWNN